MEDLQMATMRKESLMMIGLKNRTMGHWMMVIIYTEKLNCTNLGCGAFMGGTGAEKTYTAV